MRSGVMVSWSHASGLELDLGDSHSVFHKQDVLRAAVENAETTFFVPWGRGRLARFLVLQKFDGYVAERSGGQVPRCMGKASGKEASLAVCEFELDGWFAQNRVFDLRRAED